MNNSMSNFLIEPLEECLVNRMTELKKFDNFLKDEYDYIKTMYSDLIGLTNTVRILHQYKNLLWSKIFLRDLYFKLLKECVKTRVEKKYIDEVCKNTFKEFHGELIPKNYYKWVSNSCYMDSVLFIILTCSNDFWRKKLSKKPSHPHYDKKILESIHNQIVKLLFEMSETSHCLRKDMVNIKQFEMTLAQQYEAVTFFTNLAFIYDITFPKMIRTSQGIRQENVVIDYDITDSFSYSKTNVMVYTPEIDPRTMVPKNIPIEILKEFEIVGAIKHYKNHYTAYSKTFFGTFYYDDLSSILHEVDTIPKDSYEIYFLSRI